MNLPNRLTLSRVILVPFVIAAILLTGILPMYVTLPIAAVLFLITSLTDMLDGRIARKRGLITNFGKFLDPLADKIMVIGCMLTIQYKIDGMKTYFFWALLIVVFRELAVTGLRLLAASAKKSEVIPAHLLGKIKTVMQTICIMCALVEPLIQLAIEELFGVEDYIFHNIYPLTLVTTAVMVFFALWSGIDYIVTYRKFIKEG